MKLRFILLSFFLAATACDFKKDSKESTPAVVSVATTNDCDAALEKRAITYYQDLFRLIHAPNFQVRVFGHSRGGSQRWIEPELIYQIYQNHEIYKGLRLEAKGFTCHLSPIARVVLGRDFQNLQSLHSSTMEEFLTSSLPIYQSSQEIHRARVDGDYSSLLPIELSCQEDKLGQVPANVIRGYVGHLLLKYRQKIHQDSFLKSHSNHEIFELTKQIQFFCASWQSKSVYSECLPEQKVIADPYTHEFEINLKEQEQTLSELCAENDQTLKVFWEAQ